MLLLAAAQGLEIFAQPTPMDLLRILLAVLLWKGQVLLPGQGPNCCVLGLQDQCCSGIDRDSSPEQHPTEAPGTIPSTI